MGRSTTIIKDKELKVCGYSRVLDLCTSHHSTVILVSSFKITTYLHQEFKDNKDVEIEYHNTVE